MGSGHMASASSLSSSLEGTLAPLQDVEIVSVRAVKLVSELRLPGFLGFYFIFYHIFLGNGSKNCELKT